MKSEYRRYPVLGPPKTGQKEYVPWDMLALHEARVVRNHGQTLEQLAARGGLGWNEIIWILLDKPWGRGPKLPPDKAREAVLQYVAAWEVAQKKGAE